MPMQTTHHPSWSVAIRRSEPAGAASHIFSQMPENCQRKEPSIGMPPHHEPTVVTVPAI